MKKVLLSLGGYDPTSGAGTVLDLSVFRRLGFHGVGILTALTAQNTLGVDAVYCPPPDWLHTQYKSLSSDFAFSGLKVGMVGHRDNIPVISEILSRNVSIPRVIDPVFRSSSGTWLLEEEAVPQYLNSISGRIDLITPNLLEASLIVKTPVLHPDDMKIAAEKIHDLLQAPCLVKGGHLEKETLDVLFDGRDFHVFRHKKRDLDVHGTGCLLSSSVVAFLSQGDKLGEACRKAADLTARSLKRSVPIGRGQRLF